MWRDGQERTPTSMFRGVELMRLMTGIIMLAVLFAFVVSQRNADKGSAAPKPLAVSQEPQNSLPPATGPTDEDPEQADAAGEEYRAITDGTLTLGPEEMEPYDRLVFWVKNQSFAQLCRRARTDLLFTYFHDESDKYRGQLATLELNVRRILDAGKNRDGVQLYEVWGFTTESRDRLYVAIVVGLPKGMPIGPSVQEKAQFTGYFFKMQGFHSAGARPDAVPDKAPLLIGRLNWAPSPAAGSPVDGRQGWTWGLGLLAVFGLLLGFRLVYQMWIRRKPVSLTRMRDAAPGEVIPIEKWLDQSDFGAGADAHRCDEEGNTV